jgi:succinate dehydrogenase/fumarate reductase cytochrome b subunit
MTEARSIEKTEGRATSPGEGVAHVRSAVERWRTWTGLVPLPVFLVLHLARELSRAFATDVTDLVRPAPSPFAQVTSVVLVWIPLLLHVALSLRTPSPRLVEDVPPLTRLLSRVSAWLSLAFLAYHGRVYTLAVWLEEAAAEDAGFRLLAELSSATAGVPIAAGVYLLGLFVTAAHAGLGVHRGLLAEGLLETPRKRRLSARACAASGAVSFAVGAAAVIRVASGTLLR